MISHIYYGLTSPPVITVLGNVLAFEMRSN